MPIDPRFKVTGVGLKRDIRPWTVRTVLLLKKPEWFSYIMILMALVLLVGASPVPGGINLSHYWGLFDVFALIAYYYYKWFKSQLIELPFKLPAHAGDAKDRNNPSPKGGPGKAEGILFLGNVRDGPMKNDEVWITNSDARTHILFLGTTGAGKTEGLKSLVTNAMCWGSGFVYVDGKAQNTLWGDVYSLARRFGRDDDVLVLNYMTGNSDASSRSNSLNPFSIGSASYLTQMMVGLMDDSGDDNAMWKGRAISLMSALMPALTWKRDNQGLMMDVGVIRDNLTMQQIIKMSRDPGLPDRVIRGLQSYLDTLPGYVDSAFDDEGNERPPSQDQPMVDLSQTRQQHGYLTMQFTRSLSSLADEYGYIFKQQLADIDMMDVVLNRRILVVLIPALEKSPDEAANLGKIVVAALKGMMGATLGNELEGEQTTIIDNNPTTAASPFMTVFDEVGYYTSPGMGVMAAQARSLGFCLIFAGQDMPALQKRVKEEALSITGNCNLKIFGKLEDPTETKDFFEKTVSSALVSEASGFSSQAGVSGRSYFEGDNITFQARKEASYDDLKRQGQGQVHFMWAEKVVAANFFYSNPKRVNVVRVQRFLAVSPRNWSVEARDRAIADVTGHLRDKDWRAGNGAPAQPVEEIIQMAEAYGKADKAGQDGHVCAAAGVGALIDASKRKHTDAVSVPGVGLPQQGGAWPFGAADAGAALPPPMAQGGALPPWAGGGMPQPQGQQPQPQQAQPMPSASTPPWMQGGLQVAVPTTQRPVIGQPQQPQQPTPPPPYGGYQGGQQQPVQPQQPSYAPPQPPYGAPPVSPVPPAGQQLSWGNVMGAAPGMGTPPGGAQTVSAGAVPPPPAWMSPYAPPPPAAPPYTPPYQQQAGGYGRPPYGAPPVPPYVPPYQPPQPQTQAYAPPPQQPQPQQPAAPFVPPYTPPPAQPLPPWVQQTPGVVPPQPQPPAQPPVPWNQPDADAAAAAAVPASMPQRPPTPPVAPPEDVEAILRSAAGNLSGEMFRNPEEDDGNNPDENNN